MSEPRSFLVAVECTACGLSLEPHQRLGLCPSCGLVLFAQYDLAALREEMPRPNFTDRTRSLWRYRELLPLTSPPLPSMLGEGGTPLLRTARQSAEAVGLERGELLVKDEALNPTGSFKARGMAVAVARAAELHITDVALPSAGNAAAAAAAYGAAAGVAVHIAMSSDAPPVNVSEATVLGADLTLIEGLIDAAGSYIRREAEMRGWFDVSTLREPYRVEGKKTMGIELAEAGGWGDAWCPDVVVFPTGGGTGVIGMWKAFAELQELGWIGARRPKMVVVQAAGCAPLVRAYEGNSERAEPWEHADTVAAGIRVPSTIGDYLILKAIRDSGGAAVSVDDPALTKAQLDLARLTEIYASPEGAAAYTALATLRESGFLAGDETVVVFNTATGIKYPAPRQARGAGASPRTTTLRNALLAGVGLLHDRRSRYCF